VERNKSKRIPLNDKGFNFSNLEEKMMKREVVCGIVLYQSKKYDLIDEETVVDFDAVSKISITIAIKYLCSLSTTIAYRNETWN
jgi:hypothetical protein